MNFRNFAALLLVAGLAFQAAAQTPVLTVLSRDGRKPVPISAVINQEYVAVDPDGAPVRPVASRRTLVVVVTVPWQRRLFERRRRAPGRRNP